MVMQYRDIKYCLIQFGRRDWPANRYLVIVHGVHEANVPARSSTDPKYICMLEAPDWVLNFGKPANKMTLPGK